MNQPAAPKEMYETQVLALKKRLAKVHRIITAGGLWPVTKGHVSCRIPGTTNSWFDPERFDETSSSLPSGENESGDACRRFSSAFRSTPSLPRTRG